MKRWKDGGRKAPTTITRPTLAEAYAQTTALLARFDDDDHPPCCSNCGAPLDYTTPPMLCADCAVDAALVWEDA